MAEKKRLRRPEWLKVSLTTSENFHEVNGLISDHSLHTVCQEAHCPKCGVNISQGLQHLCIHSLTGIKMNRSSRPSTRTCVASNGERMSNQILSSVWNLA